LTCLRYLQCDQIGRSFTIWGKRRKIHLLGKTLSP
jgi:hypothetical protein